MIVITLMTLQCSYLLNNIRTCTMNSMQPQATVHKSISLHWGNNFYCFTNAHEVTIANVTIKVKSLLSWLAATDGSQLLLSLGLCK